MISRDVYGSFFRDVAADPQRIADRHVGAAVRDLWRPVVVVRDRRLANVRVRRTLDVDVGRVRYDHRGTDVVLIYMVTSKHTRGEGGGDTLINPK